MTLLEEMKLWVLDGSMGMELVRRAPGMDWNETPAVNGDDPEVVAAIHRDYIRAGARIITANTFCCARRRLQSLGLDGRFDELNQMGMAAALRAVEESGHKVLVAGSIGPLGDLESSPGKSPMFDRVDYSEQCEILASEGADMILIETMTHLKEAETAFDAAEETDMPVAIGFAFPQGGKLLDGCGVEDVIESFSDRKPLFIGVNCNWDPLLLPGILQRLVEEFPRVGVWPNAGFPEVEEGVFEFPVSAGRFASEMLRYRDLGAKVLGGCCGTTPEYIAALSAALG